MTHIVPARPDEPQTSKTLESSGRCSGLATATRPLVIVCISSEVAGFPKLVYLLAERRPRKDAATTSGCVVGTTAGFGVDRAGAIARLGDAPSVNVLRKPLASYWRAAGVSTSAPRGQSWREGRCALDE